MTSHILNPKHSATLDFTTRNRICLLGFSGSVLSLVFNTLQELKYPGTVVILENTTSKDTYPFESSVPYSRHWHTDYKAQPGDAFCFSIMKPVYKRDVFNFFYTTHKISRQQYISIVHPSVIRASSSSMDTGIYIEPASVISPYATIGFGVTINRGATIGHHTHVGDFATINPGVHIAGHAVIGEGSTIGIGAVVFNNITIGARSVIGGGSVVSKNIPEDVLAFGNPCKVVKSLV